MTDLRSSRSIPAVAVALALLLSAVAPSVLAAPPAATATAFATPDEVAPGNDVRFDLSFYAEPPANYSDLTLHADNPTSPSGAVLATFKDVLEQPTVGGVARGICGADGAGNLFCDFGAVSSGETVVLAVRYTASQDASGTVDVPFVFMAPGAAPSDKKKKSTKSDFPAEPGTFTINASTDFDGGYFETPTLVETTGTLGRRNPQNTSVPSFTGFQGGPIVVKELNESNQTPTCSDYEATCVAQWSYFNVANGDEFPGGFQIIVSLYGTYPNLNLLHIEDDGTVDRIDNTCTFNGSPTVPDVISCKTVEIGGNMTILTAWVTENGFGRGY